MSSGRSDQWVKMCSLRGGSLRMGLRGDGVVLAGRGLRADGTLRQHSREGWERFFIHREPERGHSRQGPSLGKGAEVGLGKWTLVGE